MKRKIAAMFGLITAVLCLSACSAQNEAMVQQPNQNSETAQTAEEAPSTDNDALVQLSTITALVSGDYYGSLTVDELLKHGNFGLGCFDGVNGEMIIADGVCYQALGDGTVQVADPAEKVPFATLCKFENDFSEDIEKCENIESLTETLNAAVNENGANSMYAVKIHTTFPKIHVRSETKQEEPYIPLDKALTVSQTEFDYENTEGTLICLYFPDYMSKLNSAGWHFHFISDDKTQGGHVLDMSFENATAEFDEASEFEMLIPDTESFQKAGINDIDQSSIDSAERQ